MSSDSDSDTDADNEKTAENNESFNCGLCKDDFQMIEMISLNCKHLCCLLCLKDYVLENLEVRIKCPLFVCNESLTDSQIREVLSEEDILRYEIISLNNIPNMYKCISPDCGSMVWSDEGNEIYECTTCNLEYCLKCSAPHRRMTCDNFKKLSLEESQNKHKDEIEMAQEVLKGKVLNSLVEANKVDLIPNDCIFICYLCQMIITKKSGVLLRACFHHICRKCLKESVLTTAFIPPKCQYEECEGTLEDREIYGILSKDELEVYERKVFTRIKLKLKTPFQCKQANCDYFCELKDANVKMFNCKKCKSKNCIQCQAVHENESCIEYQNRIKQSDIGRNNEIIEESILKGECMKCPDCKNLVKKGRGCNWIQCNNCGLELCWILKIRRWGPNVSFKFSPSTVFLEIYQLKQNNLETMSLFKYYFSCLVVVNA